MNLLPKINKLNLQNITSWTVVIVIILISMFVVLVRMALASNPSNVGQMKLYFHKENSDVNETYNSMGLTPPEPAADTVSSTTSTTNVNATPPTSFCESAGNTTDKLNDIGADSAAVANRCMATFISSPVGQAIQFCTNATSPCTGLDTASITGQFWSSESATQVASAMNIYIYRWTSGTTVTSGDRIATLTCAEPGTTATSCVPTAVAPANNITFAATDRIIAIVSMNVTTLRAGSNVQVYFDSTARAASFIKMSYTVLGNSSANKPTLSGTLDDDFTTDAATTACTTGGVAYNTKWTCLQGSATNTAGNFNAGGTTSPTGDSSSWLWLQNKTTGTASAPCDFDHNASGSCATPSNTFLYQTMPNSYADGNVTTVINSSIFYDVNSTPVTSGTPYSHSSLVLWTSNSDYLEVQVYANGATNDTGTNTVNVALNNSGTLSGATSLNASTTAGKYNNIWVRFADTGGSYQAQYSVDGNTFTNVGSTVAHGIFTRVGLNAYTAVVPGGTAANETSYAGAFEWFQSTLAAPTYNQTSYRWLANADSTTPGSALAAQNTAFTLTTSGQQFRLRQLLKINGDLTAQTSFTSTLIGGSDSGPGSPVLSQATDSSGTKWIAYYDTSGGGFGGVLSVAKNVGSGGTGCASSAWTCTTVDNAVQSIGVNASIAFDNSGNPWVGYTNNTNNDAKAAHFVSSGGTGCASSAWTCFTVESTNSTGYELSLAVDSGGIPWLSYSDSTVGALRVAKYLGGATTGTGCGINTWTCTTVDTFGALNAAQTWISFNQSSGNPWIAYSNNVDFKLRMAQFVNTGGTGCTGGTAAWSCSVIDGGPPNVGHVFLGFDSNSIAWIAYGDITNSYLRVAKYLGSGGSGCSATAVWSCSLIDNSGNITYNGQQSMTFDSSNNPWISYYDAINSNLLLAKYVGSSGSGCFSTAWTCSALDSTSDDVGSSSSISIDSSGNYWVAYDNDTTRKLRIGTANAGDFKLQFAAQGASCSSASYSDVTISSTIAFNNNLTPNDNDTITYQSGTDPTDAGQTVLGQTYKETGGFYNTSSIGNSVDGEWDFSLKDNSAPASTTYCLRISQFNGSALNTYTNYPTITTFTPGPTTDQILRGGEWFSGGAKQPFFWAN